MTSREIVYRTLESGSPERIPRQMWTMPRAELHYPEELAGLKSWYPDDIVTAPAFLKQAPALRVISMQWVIMLMNGAVSLRIFKRVSSVR